MPTPITPRDLSVESPARRRRAGSKAQMPAEAPTRKAEARQGRRGIQSIEIGFRILDFLRKTPRPVPLKAIAAGTGMAAANVHYYLVSFQAVGVVRQEADTACYALGSYALKLGIAALEQFDVFTAARPVMAELAASVGHTVFLGVWGNRGPTIVYRMEGGDNRPLLELRIGSVLPLLRSALGRNFLAHLPRDLTRELLEQELADNVSGGPFRSGAGVPRTLGEVDALAARIRKAGISWCRHSLMPHFTSLSAPIFDHTGFMSAAITLTGQVGVLDDDLKGFPARTLLEQARRISNAAGAGA